MHKGELAVYGDASLREVLHHAGIEKADGLIIAASNAPADTIVKAARELNPQIRVLSRSTYLRESQKLREAGANAVFSSEGEVALAMTAFLMRQLGATDEQIDRERDRVRAELFLKRSNNDRVAINRSDDLGWKIRLVFEKTNSRCPYFRANLDHPRGRLRRLQSTPEG